MPKTKLGWWSLGLIIAMPILFWTGMSLTDTLYQGVSAGGTIPKDIAARPALALTMLAGMGTGISAFITGMIAIFKKNERALLVFVSTVVGALLILYLAAEIAYPH
jgi:Na+/phosphate symporter